MKASVRERMTAILKANPGLACRFPNQGIYSHHKNALLVEWHTNHGIREVIRIHGVYKNRDRVNAILDILNQRYYGIGRFEAVEEFTP